MEMENGAAFDEQGIYEYLQGKLEAYKVPKLIEQIDKIREPITENCSVKTDRSRERKGRDSGEVNVRNKDHRNNDLCREKKAV